jgi:hypothetical protein
MVRLLSAAVAVAATGPAAAQSGGGLIELDALQLPRWELEEVLRIGSMDGERDSFSRISGVREAPNRESFLLDPGLPGVLVFDARGSFVRRIGRRGQGPGELMAPVSWGIARDTLWIADQRLSRVATFTLAGELIADRSFGGAASSRPTAGGGLAPVHMLPGGGYLAITPLGPDFRAVAPGRVSFQQYLVRLAPNLTVADTLFHYSVESPAIATGGGGFIGFSTLFDAPIRIFGPEIQRITIERRAARGEARSAAFRITVRSAAGEHVRSFKYRPIRVPDTVRDSIIAAVREQSRVMGRTAAETAEVLRFIDLPVNQPPISAAHLAADGTLWLQREEFAASVRWIVLKPDLTPLARVYAPQGRRPRLSAVGADAVWAVEKNDLDVESAVRYRIRKQR